MNYCKQCGQKHEASACPLAPSNWPGNVSMTPESFDAAIQAGKAQGRAEALEEATQAIYTTAGWAHNPTRDAIATAIRALSSPPPDTDPIVEHEDCGCGMGADCTMAMEITSAPAGLEETCEWAYDPDDVALWLSGCGYCFTGKRNIICPRCGKPISVKQ